MLTHEQRKRAVDLVNWAHASPHEWPTGRDVQLVCLALLDATNELAAAREALKKYANPGNWGGTNEYLPENDFWRLGNGPDVATCALAALSGGEEGR